MNQHAEGIGDRYQRETKYDRRRMGGGALDWSKRPETSKRYEHRKGEIRLPEPEWSGGTPLWGAIRNRRSQRDFTGKPIALQHLSQLLATTQGITHTEFEYPFRACPSAGALYPIETYLVVNAVKDLASGLYHYYVPGHLLELLEIGEFGRGLAAAALGQRMVRTASAVFVWTAVIYRSKWKYEERAYRYIYLDAGHIGQNLYLAATALGLGCCTIGALFDDEVNRLIGADGREETVVYLGAVGRT